jgi:para-aminobenzoate synthetase component 1
MKVDLRVFRSDTPLTCGEILARLRTRRGLVALDSAAGHPCRWSLVAFDPLRGIDAPDEARALRELVARLECGGDEVPGPFRGGFLGALAYDHGVDGEEPVASGPDPWRSPQIVGGLYTDFLVRDEERGETWLVLGEPAHGDRAGVCERRAEIEALLAAPSPPGAVTPEGPLLRHTSRREHAARIERARESIAAGDFYQANLAHRFTRTIAGEPIDLYRRLRAVNPAPYMAFLSWDSRESRAGDRSVALRAGDRSRASRAGGLERGALLSASPELLFEFDGRVARTRPIKGTVPRGKTPRADERLARALLASEKDRAELAMIVDLERNDLGRIARPGSVRVESFPHLESYASVHHLSADVVAEARAGVDAVDVLLALFPGGSITGAPKLASMRAIAALEGEGRGFFTGSAGYIDTRGRACFNILIRTLVWRPLARRIDAARGEVSFHVGSGITWSSIAADEDRETLAKGAALEAALEPTSMPRPRRAPATKRRTGTRS